MCLAGVDGGAPCECFFGEVAGAVVDVEIVLARVDRSDVEVLVSVVVDVGEYRAVGGEVGG